MEKENIKKISGVLKKCESILCITGAGISADSGLPVYRGIGGLYNGDFTQDGLPIETVLAGETLQRRPELTWKYLMQIEEKCRSAVFNRAHQVIAQMEQCFKRVWVLTQNIDGFHQAAGSKNIIDIHGDMHKLLCVRCSWRKEVRDYSRLNVPPVCPQCGHILRPEVVFFGECLPQKQIQTLMNELQKGFDVYFSIGTTSVFPYIQQPIFQAKRQGAFAVEINPDETEVSGLMDIKLRMKAAEALDGIWKEFNSKKA